MLVVFRFLKRNLRRDGSFPSEILAAMRNGKNETGLVRETSDGVPEKDETSAMARPKQRSRGLAIMVVIVVVSLALVKH